MTLTLTRETSNGIGRRHKNNHYSLQDFLTLNYDQGTIQDWNGLRNLLTTEDFIIGLQEGLEEEVGQASVRR